VEAGSQKFRVEGRNVASDQYPQGRSEYTVYDPGGLKVGDFGVAPNADGTYSVADAATGASHRRQGVATAAYDQIAADLVKRGRSLVPSADLSDEAFRFWLHRDPAALKRVKQTPERAGMIEQAVAKPKGIRAFHGSPYDFDRFDASKIGKGEGAQAYGHGLYFAENEGVARSYRQNTVVPPIMAKQYLDDAGGDFKKAAAKAKADLRQLTPADQPERLAAAADMLERGALESGKMYEVRINAEPEQFLDWDKPLSQHSPQVQDAFGKLFEIAGVPKDVVPELQGGTVRDVFSTFDLSPVTGQQVSSALKESGIPGIRYLDQGSRGKGEGTANYVIFPGNERLIEIVKKYGIAGAATLLGMSQSDLDQIISAPAQAGDLAFASPEGNQHKANALDSDYLPQDWEERDRREQNRWREQRGLPPIPDPKKFVPPPDDPRNRISGR
jgi:hypothetical protein